MTIKPGDKIPSVTVKRLSQDGLEEVNLADYVQGKNVILFAVPGAFTPTCTEQHLPSYINKADELKKQGIDEIICIAVNDPFVMAQWGKYMHADGKVTMMPDGNATFTKEVGLEMDGSGAGLGTRSKRYAMTIEDGVVTDLEIEPEASKVDLSGAEACLARLAA